MGKIIEGGWGGGVATINGGSAGAVVILGATVTQEGGGAVAQGGGGGGRYGDSERRGRWGKTCRILDGCSIGGGEVSEQHEMIISGAGTT